MRSQAPLRSRVRGRIRAPIATARASTRVQSGRDGTSACPPRCGQAGETGGRGRGVCRAGIVVFQQQRAENARLPPRRYGSRKAGRKKNSGASTARGHPRGSTLRRLSRGTPGAACASAVRCSARCRCTVSPVASSATKASATPAGERRLEAYRTASSMNTVSRQAKGPRADSARERWRRRS